MLHKTKTQTSVKRGIWRRADLPFSKVYTMMLMLMDDGDDPHGLLSFSFCLVVVVLRGRYGEGALLSSADFRRLTGKVEVLISRAAFRWDQ